MRLLVTRPQPDADRTAEALRTRGHDLLVEPLLRMQPVADAHLGGGPWSAVLVTSANAIRALTPDQRRALRALPVLAVGARTAQAARDGGFSDVRSADGAVSELMPLVLDALREASAPALYVAGEMRAHDLAALLAQVGVAAETAVVYRMVTMTAFSEAAVAALAGHHIDGVLHYSRRTANAYLACADAAGMRDAALAPVQYCLSAEIAARLAGAAAVRVASRSDEGALLALIGAA